MPALHADLSFFYPDKSGCARIKGEEEIWASTRDGHGMPFPVVTAETQTSEIFAPVALRLGSDLSTRVRLRPQRQDAIVGSDVREYRTVSNQYDGCRATQA